MLFCNLPPFWFFNRHINERDVIIWDVLRAIISGNILRKFLGRRSLIRHACQFKLQNVQRITQACKTKLFKRCFDFDN
jgi:hypothetical protein